MVTNIIFTKKHIIGLILRYKNIKSKLLIRTTLIFKTYPQDLKVSIFGSPSNPTLTEKST